MLRLITHTLKRIPEDERTILKPHGQEVTVGSHRAVSSPHQQAVLGCALKTHEKVCPRPRHPDKMDKFSQFYAQMAATEKQALL